MNFSGHPMFPAAPAFAGDFQEFFDDVPLAWCPEEIHPQTVPVPVKCPEFFPLGGNVVEIPGYRARYDAVCRRVIHHHEIVARRPHDPDLQVVLVPETFGVIGML
jgi:hypothetical protein